MTNWQIDFTDVDDAGRERRYRRDANVQTAAGAQAEGARLRASTRGRYVSLLRDLVARAVPRTPEIQGSTAPLDLPGWSFHSLRHYFISELVRAGASVEVVILLARHSKLDVTQRYVHAQAQDLRSAVASLERV